MGWGSEVWGGESEVWDGVRVGSEVWDGGSGRSECIGLCEVGGLGGWVM